MRVLILAGLILSSYVCDTTPSFAVIKGGDLPHETCLRRNKNGTTTTGACSEVCKDKTIYEPDTDAEVDAVSSGGGVCNEAAKLSTTGLKLSTKPLSLSRAGGG